MSIPHWVLFSCLCLALTGPCRAANLKTPPLPDWQVLVFEETAFWATARSRLEVLPGPDDDAWWEFDVMNSVVDNSEQIWMRYNAITGETVTRSRLSKGKDRRMKSYEYDAGQLLRKRLDPLADPGVSPENWPTIDSRKVPYPVSIGDVVVTSTYPLLLLAQRLQAQGPRKSLEVIVHTDLNFYRVRLTSGNGIPVKTDYEVIGQGGKNGKRETMAVALLVTPEGALTEKDDFSFFGLQGELILFFDRSSGLPLQIRGTAPRIGDTAINLKSVTMRNFVSETPDSDKLIPLGRAEPSAFMRAE